MFRVSSMALSAALLFSADVSSIVRFHPPAARVEFPADENLPVLPDMAPTQTSAPAAKAPPTSVPGTNSAQASKVSSKIPGDEPLKPESRLSLVRFVSGEFARVVSPIPAGKKGFRMKAGAPLDEKALRMALGGGGAAMNPGDAAQITTLEFKEREIVVDINGGGRGKTRLRDRIHMEIGGVPSMSRTAPPEAAVKTDVGATLILEFDKPVPDMTPDQLKQYLSGMLDFSKQHSAAVQWVESLPPEIQTAIKEKRPVVGMDREMVQSALGRPDKKVRERTPDGTETEDWIYGKPPAKTIFVRFEGEKVTQVRQFPQ